MTVPAFRVLGVCRARPNDFLSEQREDNLH
jgi:hypothetical protein